MLRVIVWEPLDPTFTELKLTLDGLTVSCMVVPVPDSGTARGEFVAVLANKMLPVTLVVPVGAKLAVKLALCPAARVKGNVRPVRLKPMPLGVALLTVIAELPLLVSVIV